MTTETQMTKCEMNIKMTKTLEILLFPIPLSHISMMEVGKIMGIIMLYSYFGVGVGYQYSIMLLNYYNSN